MGRRLTAQQGGAVEAKSNRTSSWERFVIDREKGRGGIQSGDAVFLTAWTGKTIAVQKDKAVHAKSKARQTWERLTIEKSKGGAIFAGDEIFLRAWTGKIIEADAPGSAGVVQARSSTKGDWEKLVIEAASVPRTTAAPVQKIQSGASGVGDRL